VQQISLAESAKMMPSDAILLQGRIMRPFRSALYLPASNARAMEKAQSLGTDAIIFDLEDAVAPAEKSGARQTLMAALNADYGTRARIVRINGADTVWGRADLEAFGNHPNVDAILLPKVNAPQDLDISATRPLWAMIETALGVLNAAAIASHPALQGMVMGTNDLAREINSRFRPDRLALQTGLGLCVLAAKAHGQVILDGVYNAFKDDDGLRAECEQGRDLGFDGKTLIHPAQLAIANRAFAPSDAEIDLARRQIDAFDAALSAGLGVAVLDGKIVENLHILTAKALLAKAAAVAQLEDAR